MISKYAKFIPAIVFLAIIVFASSANAQTDLVDCSGDQCDWCDAFSLVQNVINALAGIVGFVMMTFLMYGGFQYVIGSMSGSDKVVQEAKATITNAIVGFVITLLSFVIANSITLAITGAPIEEFLSIECA
ncbi:hypothetical protein ACFL2D_01905 [Patescibacteria group bacterium]